MPIIWQYIRNFRDGDCQCYGGEAGKKLLARGCPQLLLSIPDDNTATLSMFDKLAYDECQQDSLTYSKRLITDPEY